MSSLEIVPSVLDRIRKSVRWRFLIERCVSSSVAKPARSR